VPYLVGRTELRRADAGVAVPGPAGEPHPGGAAQAAATTGPKPAPAPEPVKRVVMTRGLAHNLAEEVLYRRFAFMDSTYGNGYRCRVLGKRHRRSLTGFFVGDPIFDGVVT
jgi:hypothetical protein